MCGAGHSARRNVHIEPIPGRQIIVACVDYLVAGRVLVVVNGNASTGHVPVTDRGDGYAYVVQILYTGSVGEGNVVRPYRCNNEMPVIGSSRKAGNVYLIPCGQCAG